MKPNLIKIILAAVFLAAAIFSFTSCNPLKKAQTIAKAQPEKFVEIIRDKFPCVPGTLPDTTIRTDSAAFIEAITNLIDENNANLIYIDSLIKSKKDTSNCETAWYEGIIKMQDDIITSLNKRIAKIPAVHDTIPKPYPVTDLAQVQAKQNIIDSLRRQIADLTVVNKNFVGENASLKKFKKITIWILVLLVVGLIGGFLLKKYVFVAKAGSKLLNLVKDST